MRYFLAIVLSLMVSLPLYAKEKSRTLVSINVGVGYPATVGLNDPILPISPSHNWTMGFQFGGSLGYAIDSQNRFSVMVSADYINYQLSRKSNVRFQGGSVNFLSVFSNLKMSFRLQNSNLSPYIKCGTGLFRASISQITESYQLATDQEAQIIIRSGSIIQNRIGFGFGTGIDLSLTDRLAFFAEAQYQVGLTRDKNSQHIPFKVGILYQ